MRFVAISDMHSMHRQIRMPEGDILLFAGDITNVGETKDYVDFNSWLAELNFQHIIGTLGNHEMESSDPKNLALIRKLLSNATLLIDESIEIDGLKIYGSPWQPWFFNWEWNFPEHDSTKGYSFAKEIWAKIPDDVDILITHGPPKNMLDAVPNGHNKRRVQGDRHTGCPILAERIKQLPNLKLSCHGHIHHSYGMVKTAKTIFINASICNEAYQPVNAPIVVDL